MSTEYQNCLVTFFDILGFSKLVSEEKSAEKINDILDTIRYISQPHSLSNYLPKLEEIECQIEELIMSKQKISTSEEFKKREINFKNTVSDLGNIHKPEMTKKGQMNRVQTINFSDSIIRVVPLYAVSSLFKQAYMMIIEFFTLNHILADLALKNISIRGGVTIGAINAGEFHVFGPAFIKAYKLESSIARYPRIIVDSTVLDFLNSPQLAIEIYEAGLEISFREIIENHIRMDHDGLWFMNYIEGKRRLMKKSWFEIFIRNHKVAITARIKNEINQTPLDYSIIQKLFWLANYHNSCVENIGDDEFAKMNLDPLTLKIDLPKLDY